MFLQAHLLENLYSDIVYVCMYLQANYKVHISTSRNSQILGLILDLKKNSPRLWNTSYSLYVVLLARLSYFSFFTPTLELMPSAQHWWKGRQIHNPYYRWLKRLHLLNHHKAFCAGRFPLWNVLTGNTYSTPDSSPFAHIFVNITVIPKNIFM